MHFLEPKAIWHAAALVIVGLCTGLLSTAPLPVIALFLGLLILVICWALNISPTYAIWAGMTCVLISTVTTSAAAPTPTDPNDSNLSLVLRVLGIALLIAVSIQNHGDPNEHVGRIPRLQAIRFVPIFLPVALLLMTGMALHGLWQDAVLYCSGLVLVLIALTLVRRIPPASLLKGTSLGLATCVFGSLGAGLLVPTIGFGAGSLRLRGLVSNPNELGFYTFVFASISITAVRKPWLKYAVLSVCAAVLVLTQSRSSALALVVFVAVSGLSSRNRISRWIAMGLAAIVALLYTTLGPLVSSMQSRSDGLLRSQNTRGNSYDEAMRLWSTHRLVGAGWGSEHMQIASSPLRALAYAGVVGVLCVLAIWIAMILQACRSNVETAALAIAFVVHSMFEGWIMSPVSPLFLVAMVSLLVMASARQIEDGTLTHDSERATSVGVPPKPARF